MNFKVFDNSNILVTGGAGFVGSNLVKLVLSKSSPKKIRVVDNLLSSEKENLPLEDSRIEFTKGSITDDKILASLKDDIDYVFHLCTYHGNQSSIHDPIADHDNNTLTTLKLFNKLKDFKNIKKIVYSAAGCAVAAKDICEDAEATQEDAPIAIDMDSPYSISKIIGEFYSVYFFKQHKLPVVRARFQNVYGPGEVLGAGKWRGTPATVWRNVTPTFIYKALCKKSLPLENAGQSSRDFIYVEDICRGLLSCAAKGTPGDVYNLASGRETTIRQLAETINRLAENPTPCEIFPPRQWDHSIRRFGSPAKAEKELSFKINTELEDGLAKTVKWTKDNFDFITRNIKKHKKHMPELA